MATNHAAGQGARPQAPRRRWRRGGGNSPEAPASGKGPIAPTPERPVLVPDPSTGGFRFGQMELSHDLACALSTMGYAEPTPVQRSCIPLLMSGRDVAGQAQTGTGKTAAFGIPMVERVEAGERRVQGLVLAPTRELAVQVAAELSRLAQFKGISVVVCYGGHPLGGELLALGRGAHIVVGTPGRVLDHISRGSLVLDGVRMAVLDEADEMLDIGFLPDVERILARTPASRQTALFSATLPGPIRRIVHRHMRQPAWVRLGGEVETVPTVRQVYYEVWEEDRVAALREVLESQLNGGKALVFRRTQAGVDRLARALGARLRVAAIHGGLPQSQRNAVMDGFRSGAIRVLVATNVAARGLDIPQVSHVVNFDMPETVEEYVHRIGRTARLGRDGTAITFVTEWTTEMLDALQGHLGGRLEAGSLAMYAAH